MEDDGKNQTRPEGRPSKYDPEQHPRLARELTGEGKTLADLAKAFGVARSTIEQWQKNHTEFSVAIRQGREDSADRVERALFERAIGYEHPETKLMTVSMGGEMGSRVERHEVVTRYPPDTAAASLFLRNRRPKDWKDKQVVEHQGLAGLAKRLAAGKARADKREAPPAVVPPPDAPVEPAP